MKKDYEVKPLERGLLIILFLGLLTRSGILFGQSSPDAPADHRIHLPFRVVEWNVENLFDTRHDTLKNDYEFLPDGHRHWTYARYRSKLVRLAQVITALGQWTPPALIGCCEIENDSVLYALTQYSPLKAFGYRYLLSNSPDLRGIDVALLYQPGVFKPLSAQSILIPPLPHHRPTRPILHVAGKILTGDTLDVLVCHFPSRSGGAQASEPYRIQAAQTLRRTTDSLLHIRHTPQLLIMGDFNDYPHNASLRKILEVKDCQPPYSPHQLYHLLARKVKKSHTGSYKHQGQWGLLDHILVSGHLLNPQRHFYTSETKAQIFAPPFLLTGAKGEEEPFRTFLGMRYLGGFSDHLPLYTDFELIIE